MARRKHKLAIQKRPPLYSGKILLISYKRDDAEKIEEALSQESHVVDQAPSIEEGERLLEKRGSKIQVVLIDTAKEAFDALLASQRLKLLAPHIQIILMTEKETTPSPEKIVASLQVGAVDYLVKPLHPERINQAVRRALEYYSIQRMMVKDTDNNYRLDESLKAITAALDTVSLNRTAPGILQQHLRKTIVGLFKIDHQKEGATQFVPISTAGISRRLHFELAGFLNWFYDRRWHRFNRPSVLRGTYRPWNLKQKLGRFTMLLPMRHKGGLWGAVLVSRSGRGLSFSRKEKATAATIASHLARTYYILNHYKETRERAFLDTLTGLYNQRYFTYFGEQEFLRTKSARQHLSILTVNVRSFKRVNEEHGHLVGGRLLAHVGQIIKQATRDSDVVVRLDGDWFVAFLPNTNTKKAKIVEKRIHQLLTEDRFVIRKTPVVLGASVGLASFPDDGDTLQAILDTSKQRQQA